VTLRRIRLISLAAALSLLALLSVLGVLAAVERARSHAASVPAPLAVGTELQRPRPVPDVQLIDLRGRRFSLTAWRGKWVVLAPSMTLCTAVCPMTTGALMQLRAQLQKAGLSRRVVVAEVTVDPWRDSPARLRAYQRMTGTNLAMLTGTQRQIRRLWTFFDVYYHRVPQSTPADIDWMTHRAETFDVTHTDALFFLDPAGQERIVDAGMPDVAGRLSTVLRDLLSTQGRQNLAHPQLPWTATDALDDLYYLMNRNIPASALPKLQPPSAQAAQRALAGSPSPLASIHSQAGELLGPETALAARLKALRGYPVVINAWASWCAGCRAEFPIFAAASARYGRQIAFLGVDTNDSASEARSFLARHPVSYPSYQTSSAQLAPLAAIDGMPTTIFINRAGTVINVHIAQYETESALQNDIEHYALGVTG
jgi:cytochrome oxidase Cu insertion factor (SCO1/SenC/PrrC family)/thiol-disulfide isomerase/thioredoxin